MKGFVRNKRIAAFTLAEVLITLGIIGVVAAMTIPVLMNSIQENQFKTAYKKAFSVASQAWQSAYADYRLEVRPNWTDPQSRIDNFDVFRSYFKVAKICNSGNNSQCWVPGEKYWNAPEDDANAFVDASGMSWSIASMTSSRGGDIYVDTNGFKKPNKFGQDRFAFLPLTSDGATSTVGIPIKIMPQVDCINTTSCPDYANSCPSIATHPCNYTSWLYN